jgi:hypothetical protein
MLLDILKYINIILITLVQCIQIPVPSVITHTGVLLYITIITVVVTEVLS